MNVLWLTTRCPFPVDNGGKNSIANRMKYVAKRHNIYLITQSEEVTKEVNKELKKICKDYALVPPRKKNYIKWFLTGSVNVAKYKNVLVTEAIEKFIAKYKIDLINVDSVMAAVALAPIWDSLKDIKIVINQHNIDSDCVRSKIHTRGISLLKKIYSLVESSRLEAWERKFYKKCNVDAQIFVSEEDLKFLKNNFKIEEKTRLIYSPPIVIDSAAIRNELGEEGILFENGKNIVFPAAFDYGPNIHGCIWFVESVYPQIRKKVDGVRLILAGRNPDKRICNLSCEDIIVTGTVPDISPYFILADLLVIPIFFGGGVKTKLIEAGAYGKPVVSTSSGAKGSIYKEEIIVTDDPEEFALYCIDVLKKVFYKIN